MITITKDGAYWLVSVRGLPLMTFTSLQDAIAFVDVPIDSA